MEVLLKTIGVGEGQIWDWLTSREDIRPGKVPDPRKL